MELVNASRKLTIREYKAIEANLRAFEHNFGKLYLHKSPYDKGFRIYLTEADAKGGRHIHSCNNIEYLNGWLYGVVQGGIVRYQNKPQGDICPVCGAWMDDPTGETYDKEDRLIRHWYCNECGSSGDAIYEHGYYEFVEHVVEKRGV